ncbi:glycoside hydrolase N-terminal domain-containing protein [Streptomyces sp. NBC_00102]|uniref:glycosyl hydrolase family 95 catalytic domain-containing protein n=1 Tax=Streptomyces sp. NBC_00102 TaxID=2975652 RepID=UPI002254BFF1|nr:glycoside hydrolase N-terminal domain-containing protein [Streptomyces sp. NBC_00102]MCX5400972.1 glycoside hydrolase family 95 protein [Streptomyces sp. NBC_00102]
MIRGTWEPRPAARWEDAFLSGNGHHGAMVYGDPVDDRVIVDHHTLVRPNGSEHLAAPELAEELGAIQNALLAGDTEAAERFGAGRPLVWVQPFHPAFQTRVRRSGADGLAPEEQAVSTPPAGPEPSAYRRDLDFASGQATASSGRWRSQVFVSRADDVIVQHITGPASDVEVSLDPALPGAPAGLAIGRATVLTPHGARLALRLRYPDSELSCIGVTTLRVEGGTVSVDGDGVRVTGARSLLLLTRVRRGPGDPDLDAEWAALPDSGYATLMDRHLPLHHAAFGRCTLSLHDEDPARQGLPGSELLRHPESPALLERLFAAGRYHLLSASGLLPPRLTGLWTGDWDTAWSGAFTTNANLNLQLASAATADLPEVLDAHTRLIEDQLEHWRENARALFGCRGIVAPSHSDGESGHTRHFQRAYPLHLWTAGADWLLQPLLERAAITGVVADSLVSACVEVADFYADFLTREGPDGTVAIVPSYSPENRPANASWGTVNATMDIAAARHALTAAAELAPAHPDADRWRSLAARLPRYVVNEDGALAEWAWPGLRETYDHRHLSHLYPVWPLDEINPYDTPGPARAAHRALELRGSENDSAHGHLHHALVAARLRDGSRVSSALASVLAGDFFHDSLMSAHYPDRNVYNADAAHALPAVVLEMLVQSGPGRLVLLPALPAAYPRGSLRGVRTRFGAALDLSWTPEEVTAVLRPARDARVELRTGPPPGTPGGAAEPGEASWITLTAGADRVLTVPRRETAGR